MSTVGAIADFAKTALDSLEEYKDNPARRLQIRLDLKNKSLELADKILQEDDPDEAAKLSTELRDLVMSF
jgi:hypothetical protein